jgi:hypothetical protein
MPRRIRITVENATAVAELMEELSPQTTEAFWQTLPIDSVLGPGRWSGHACYFLPEGEHLKRITRLESPVCSIYPGTIVLRPGGAEGLIAYGPAEYRWAIGTDYTTPVAKVVGPGAELMDALARTHDDGDKRIHIERIDE